MPAPTQNTKYNKEVITDYVKLSRGLINSRQKILMGKIILASLFLKSNDNTKCFEKEEDKNKPAYISENLAKLNFLFR